ncbi:hypothetical protein EON81_10730 [bacterium]|nr:MAG: hypothetical protein EON81_10730 [bacterium]
MFFTTNAAQLLSHQRGRFAKMELTQQSVHQELIRGGVRDHAELTSGGVSDDTLEDMGHPFGRTMGADGGGVRGIVKGPRKLTARQKRKGNVIRKGVLAPLPINRQKGDLRSSFTKSVANNHDTTMGFTAKHAKYVLSPWGTEKMVARGFYSMPLYSQTPAYVGPLRKRHRLRRQAAFAEYRVVQKRY